MSRFYNPGFTFSEKKRFDNPISIESQANNISYLDINAPAHDFFTVEDVGTVILEDGETHEVPLKFRPIILKYYAERGVICVDPKRKDIREDEPFAATDDEAIAKGNRVWKRFMKNTASEWFRIVQNAKAQGAIPANATGLFKRVLDELGMRDPADVVDGLQEAQKGQADNKELQARLDEQAKQFAALQAQMTQLLLQQSQSTQPTSKAGK